MPIIVGQEKELQFNIVTPLKIRYAEWMFEYDPTYLEVVDSNANQEGIQIRFQQLYDDSNIFAPVVTLIEPGKIMCGVSSKFGSPPIDEGFYELFLLWLRAKKVGLVSLSYSKFKLGGIDGTIVPSQTEGGISSIIEEGQLGMLHIIDRNP